jgi:hypothetical protein
MVRDDRIGANKDLPTCSSKLEPEIVVGCVLWKQLSIKLRVLKRFRGNQYALTPDELCREWSTGGSRWVSRPSLRNLSVKQKA